MFMIFFFGGGGGTVHAGSSLLYVARANESTKDVANFVFFVSRGVKSGSF